MKLHLSATLAIAGALALCACETATPYQPLVRSGSSWGGFSDRAIDADHVQVSFQGNALTSRATVENYLLYRAAELTVARGCDWFEAVDRHTDRQGHTVVEPLGGPGFGYGYGFWRPGWRYFGAGFGWRSWGPWGGAPFWADEVDVQTVEKFEATAEIALGRGAKPANDPRAFDARQVLANLGPKIQRPTAHR